MTDYRMQRADDSVTHDEQPAFAPLSMVDFERAAHAIDAQYRNFVAFEVNDHCVRVAVMEGEFRWHRHQRFDECFLVLEGELEIDLADGTTVHLVPGQAFLIPRDIVHRTRAQRRTVNLCFEHRDAYTDVVFEDATGANGSSSRRGKSGG